MYFLKFREYYSTSPILMSLIATGRKDISQDIFFFIDECHRCIFALKQWPWHHKDYIYPTAKVAKSQDQYLMDWDLGIMSLCNQMVKRSIFWHVRTHFRTYFRTWLTNQILTIFLRFLTPQSHFLPNKFLKSKKSYKFALKTAIR